MDSTLRSNATVGPPIEALYYDKNSQQTGIHYLLEENHEYLVTLRESWGARLQEAFQTLPDLQQASVPSASIIPMDR